MRATWKPHEKHGRLTKRADLPDTVFAYPGDRAEPLTDASHVRTAIARFDQVTGVSDDQRESGFCEHQESRQALRRKCDRTNLGTTREPPQDRPHGERPKGLGEESRRHAQIDRAGKQNGRPDEGGSQESDAEEGASEGRPLGRTAPGFSQTGERSQIHPQQI